MKTAQFAALCCTYLIGILPVAVSAQPYLISANGTEVTDQATGLIWRRCHEGMNWNGTTCAGVDDKFDHEEALQHAAAQASSIGVAWRLPNIKELTSIVDKRRHYPAIDTTAFSATPGSGFWSVSFENPKDIRYVSFGHGFARLNGRNGYAHVRLVRSSEASA